MKEHPILFNTEMVQAILAGRKTQTRRVIKAQFFDILPTPDRKAWVTLDKKGGRIEENRGSMIKCRYGVPGDRLWVRETWQALYSHGVTPRDIPHNADIIYKTEDAGNILWRPSIHMPRWVSRITLEVLDVRVQRVKDILDGDAIAEGINPKEVAARGYVDARIGFRHLWDSINAKRGYSWEANPYVWAISFKVIKND